MIDILVNYHISCSLS